MTSHVARLYALVGAVLVFFVTWAAIATHPWQAPAGAVQDPRVAALQAREQRLQAEAIAVRRIVDRRWATYRAELALRRREIAAVRARNARTAAAASLASARAAAPLPTAPAPAPSVRVVTLPPLTITRTS